MKGYGFLSFARNIDKNIGKNKSKNLSGKYSQKLLNHAKQSATGEAEATGDFISNKIAIKITGVSKIHNRIIQKQLQMNMIKKYLKKDIYLQKKDRELLMI